MKGLLNKPPPQQVIAVDIETDSLIPEQGKIRLISWADRNGSYASEKLDNIAHNLANPDILKVFHNAAFDVYWLKAKGYEAVNYTDTLVMAQIINNKVVQANSLADVAWRYLRIRLDKGLQEAKNWVGELTEQHLEYGKKDAEMTYRLYWVLMDRIEELYLEGVLEREIKALPAIIKLKTDGIIFDYLGWSQQVEKFVEEKDSLEDQIKQELGAPNLNLRSPQQLKEALTNIGIEVDSTTEEVLAKYEDLSSIIATIRKYKKLQKKISSFGDKLKSYIGVDGRIRGDWRLIGTNTSRMSCTSPNLQGMPTLSKQYFKASKGNKFIIADYAQIELVVLAQLSNDPVMLESFRRGIDLHVRTAAMILGKSPEEVTATERKIAKTANFGLIYGMSAYGLQKRIKAQCGIDLTLAQAEQFRNCYFQLYQGVRDFQDSMLKSQRIESLGGKYWDKEIGELPAGAITRFNYPIQTTAAEGFKESLAILLEQMGAAWKLVCAIHDEIVLEVPEPDASRAAIVLEESMIKGMTKLIDKVPVRVDVKIGDHWLKD